MKKDKFKKKMQKEAHKYFEANLLDGDKMKDCGKAIITIDEDFIEVFDEMIDRTIDRVREEERKRIIAGLEKEYEGQYSQVEDAIKFIKSLKR